MPTMSTPRRVTKTKISKAAAGAKPRRVKTRKAAASAETAGCNALLVAQFAEALGHKPACESPSKRRSLTAALQQARFSGDVFEAMPGARVACGRLPIDGGDVQLLAPCIAVHRRHRILDGFKTAGSFGLAAIVSLSIITATAFGIAAQAPALAPAAITLAAK